MKQSIILMAALGVLALSLNSAAADAARSSTSLIGVGERAESAAPSQQQIDIMMHVFGSMPQDPMGPSVEDFDQTFDYFDDDHTGAITINELIRGIERLLNDPYVSEEKKEYLRALLKDLKKKLIKWVPVKREELRRQFCADNPNATGC